MYLLISLLLIITDFLIYFFKIFCQRSFRECVMLNFLYFGDFSMFFVWIASLIEHEITDRVRIVATIICEVLEFNCLWFFNSSRLFLFFVRQNNDNATIIIVTTRINSVAQIFISVIFTHKTIWPRFLQTTRMTYEISLLKGRNHFLANLPLFTIMSSLITLRNDEIYFSRIF